MFKIIGEGHLLQTWYEDDDISFHLEHYDGTSENKPECIFIHCDVKNKKISTVKKLRAKGKELKQYFIDNGITKAHAYSQNKKIARVFEDMTWAAAFVVDNQRYELFEWELK